MNSQHRPPKLALRFLRWYCHPDYLEDIEGDLLERFETRVAAKGMAKARWRFVLDVIRLFRPGIIRPWEGYQQLNHYGMFKNALTLSFRNLRRHKLYTMVSIVGLTLGFASLYSVFTWTRYLSDFDSFHRDSDQIYCIVTEAKTGNTPIKVMMAPLLAGEVLHEKIPSVQASTFTANFFDEKSIRVKYGEASFYERGGIMVADSTFFNVFTFGAIHGDLSEALKGPDQIVLSKTVYEKIFKDEYPVGKVLKIKDKDYAISAVVEVPFNSQLQFNYIISSTSFSPDHYYFEWSNISFPLYLRLVKNAVPDLIMEELRKEYISRSTYPQLAEAAKSMDIKFKLVPFKRIKYEHDFTFPPIFVIHPGLTKDIYVYLLLLGGAVIMIIAFLNFINLCMVQVEKNRKTLFVIGLFGSKRHYLVRLLTEIGIIYFSSLVLSMGVIWLCLQQVRFMDMTHFIPYLVALENVGMLLVVCLSLTLITAGIISASIRRPKLFIEKLLISRTGRNTSFHGGLVVLQFTISITILLSAIFVFKQFSLMLDQDLGFNQDQIITIEDTNLLGKQTQVFKQNLLEHKEIIAASFSNYVPPNSIGNNNSLNIQGQGDNYLFASISTDSNFVDVYQLRTMEEFKNLKGQNWCIINAAGKDQLEYNENTDGLILHYNGQDYELRAVIEDPLFEPLHFSPRPLVIIPGQHWDWQKLSMRVSSYQVDQTLEILENEWNKITDFPFEYEFLDQSFAAQYENERAMSKVLAIFSWIAGSISLIGLLAIALNLIALRTKEIAIRKVIGARTEQIVLLLTTTFSRWLVMSCVIAIPCAYFILQNWLSNFAFRTSLDWPVFLLTGIVVLIISLFSIAYHTVKAAVANPVDTLKNE